MVGGIDKHKITSDSH